MLKHNRDVFNLIHSWMITMSKDVLQNVVEQVLTNANELLKRYVENPSELVFKENYIQVKEKKTCKITVPPTNKYLLPDMPQQNTKPLPPRYDVLVDDKNVFIFLEVAGFTKGPDVLFDSDTYIVTISGYKAKPKIYQNGTPRISRYFGQVKVEIDLSKEIPSCPALQLETPFLVDPKVCVLKVILKKIVITKGMKEQAEEEYEDEEVQDLKKS